MAACAGSRREVSISESAGVILGGIEGAGGGGMVVDVEDARASQADFSSSRRFTSSSRSSSVALFLSFCGFGLLTTGGGAVSSLLNQSDSSGLLAKSVMSSCCIARAAIIAFAFLTSPDGFSGSARDPHHVSSCFIRLGSGKLCSMYL